MDDSGLKMSRRIRRTPFTEDVENHNVSGYTVVNHTLLPKSFGRTLEEDYWHLKKYVQIWDVGCQRQVQIKGQDAERFVQWLTPRNLSKAKSVSRQLHCFPLTFDRSVDTTMDHLQIETDYKLAI